MPHQLREYASAAASEATRLATEAESPGAKLHLVLHRCSLSTALVKARLFFARIYLSMCVLHSPLFVAPSPSISGAALLVRTGDVSIGNHFANADEAVGKTGYAPGRSPTYLPSTTGSTFPVPS